VFTWFDIEVNNLVIMQGDERVANLPEKSSNLALIELDAIERHLLEVHLQFLHLDEEVVIIDPIILCSRDVGVLTNIIEHLNLASYIERALQFLLIAGLQGQPRPLDDIHDSIEFILTHESLERLPLTQMVDDLEILRKPRLAIEPSVVRVRSRACAQRFLVIATGADVHERVHATSIASTDAIIGELPSPVAAVDLLADHVVRCA
jgi:hypothetical protein